MITPFGKTLRKFRIDLGINLGKMAEEIGISAAYLSSIETGKRDIQESQIKALSSYLELKEEEKLSFELSALRSNSQIGISLEDKSLEQIDTITLLARRISDLPKSKMDKINKLLS